MENKINQKSKCPFCSKMMVNICGCGSYKVTEATSDLKLKEQDYGGKLY